MCLIDEKTYLISGLLVKFITQLSHPIFTLFCELVRGHPCLQQAVQVHCNTEFFLVLGDNMVLM